MVAGMQMTEHRHPHASRWRRVVVCRRSLVWVSVVDLFRADYVSRRTLTRTDL